MRTVLSILIMSLITYGSAVAQGGYEIDVRIKGMANKECLLAYHFGGKQYIQDSVVLDEKGAGTFKGDEKLLPGIYLVSPDRRGYVEVIIDEDQTFSVSTDTTAYYQNVQVEGSAANTRFRRYQDDMVKIQRKMRDLRTDYNTAASEADKKAVQTKMEALQAEGSAYEAQYVETNPDDLLSAVIRMRRDPEIPDSITEDREKYFYFKDHYFDGLDFCDHRLLRTPILESRIKYYFEKLVAKSPDSIMVEAERLIERARCDSNMFEYMVKYFFNEYATSKIMCMDKMLVFMAENYYLNCEAWWYCEAQDTANFDKLQKRYQAIKPCRCGEKAKNITMRDTAGNYHTLYDVNAKHTVLIFWDSGCGHCKKELPKLKKVYNKYAAKGVEVFAVSTEVKDKQWKKYLRENDLPWDINVIDIHHYSQFRRYYDIYSTPVIYLLDEDKVIKAKRLSVDQLDELLGNILNKG